MRHLTPSQRDVWDFMSEVEKAFDGFWREPVTRRTEAFAPAVDLQEEKEHFLVSVDLPGVKQEDVSINVESGRLHVTGTRQREERKEEGLFKRYERSYGRFERVFQLPQNVDENKISARMENGVLEVVIPKAELAKPRTIQIEAKKH